MNIINENVRQSGLNPLVVIDRLIADSELTETQYKDAATSYKAVAGVLSKPESKIQILSPDIFPQGSMRLGTTVRPIGSDHFDLDMVCWLNASDKTCTPDQVYNWVWETLGNDAAYRDRRQKKNRCIRINYAEGKKFHLDVTPAIPDSTQANGSLFVPDRELKIWSPSHPIGFADEWFKKAAEKMPRYELLKEAVVFANRAKIEELPEYGAFEKKPLQRIVQLLKRHRDHYFQENKEYRPTSILLTTLVTHSYLETVKLPVKNLVEFIGNVLVGVPKYIVISGYNGSKKYSVINPTTPSEDFARNWTLENYSQFIKWHSKLIEWYKFSVQTKGQGFDKILNRLSESFGNESVIKAASALGADTSILHESGKLRVDKLSGKIGAVGTAIRTTTFFGNGR